MPLSQSRLAEMSRFGSVFGSVWVQIQCTPRVAPVPVQSTEFLVNSSTKAVSGPVLMKLAKPYFCRSQAECREFDPPRPLCLPPMSLDDTGGFSLTNPADSASSGGAGGEGPIGADGRKMAGNDPDGRWLVQARAQQVVQGVVGKRALPGGRAEKARRRASA